MDRRELLLGGTAALSMLAAAPALAGKTKATTAMPMMEHHHHGSTAGSKLAASAADCIQTGQVCLNHCLQLLADGDKMMAACARTISDVLAVCGALQQLANANSPFLPKLAAVAREACQACSDECKKHAEMHEQCKACMDSCDACVRECQAVAVA